MGLTAGTRLGPYEVLSAIGAGGMGEVYRARDTKLNRDVALKILPPAFASDPDRLARFHREAQVLASLNHPHIAAIYGFEDSGDTHALMLELVEGPTLADRIAQGPIPVEEALPIAAQIAEALEAAHEQGIIHRDLKPANIKVRPDGSVKVLDFGLAKLADPGFGTRDSGFEGALSMSPTITSPAMMTGVGVMLGTAAYMSPEQARGKAVDKRADIWAFGCVLFEMITGKRAFAGDDVTDTIASVVRSEPDWSAIPEGAVSSLQHLLRRCLEKDVRRRLRDIGDARNELEETRHPEASHSQSHAARHGVARAALVVITTALVIGAAALSAGYAWRGRTMAAANVARLVRATIDLPTSAPLALGTEIPAIGFDAASMTLSSDAGRLVYVGASSSGTLLYLRDLATETVTPLAGTDGARYAFFSPDNRWVGFLTDDKLKKVAIEGGAAVTISNARVPLRAVWMPDGTIYFDQDQGIRVSRVSDAGGAATDVQSQGLDFFLSDVLPDGQYAIGTFKTKGMSSDYADVAVLALATGEKKVVVTSAYDARYIPTGHLLFGRGGNLYAVAFDAARRQAIGDPVLVARGAAMDSLFNEVHASAAGNLLVYAAGGDRAIGRPAWVDRAGKTEFLDVPARTYGVINLAPAGDRFAAHIADVTDYVWIYDMTRGEGRKMSTSGNAGWPIWSPDASRIAFTTWASSRDQNRVVSRPVDGGGSEEELAPLNPGWTTGPSSWSPDGTVAMDVFGVGFRSAFRTKDGRLEVAGRANIDTWGADFSPDGRWIAFSSDETGQFEVRVRSYPDGKISRQISTDGGIEPRWCRCGELFFRNGNRWMSATIRTSPELQWTPPQPAFQTDFIDTPGRSYDVSPDGKRLLVIKRITPDVRDRIAVVMNWTQALNSAAR